MDSTGIKKSDPRLKETIERLKKLWRERHDVGSVEAMNVDKETFKKIIKENIVLISRALRHQFVIPEFVGFCKHIEDFYWKCKSTTGGKVADYIPQLAKVDPNQWGVSICTVDGQRFSIGDTNVPFTFQSSGKPINYAIALNHLGTETVHSFVGQEPSGRMFNELVLDHNRRPHNPMVNAGAIVICSLLLYMIEVGFKIDLLGRESRSSLTPVLFINFLCFSFKDDSQPYESYRVIYPVSVSVSLFFSGRNVYV